MANNKKSHKPAKNNQKNTSSKPGTKEKPSHKDGKSPNGKPSDQKANTKPGAGVVASGPAPKTNLNSGSGETKTNPSPVPPVAPDSNTKDSLPQDVSAETNSGESAPMDNTAPTPTASRETKEEMPEIPVGPSPAVISDDLKDVGPQTSHSDEQKLAKFLQIRNNPKSITNDELGRAGVNMRKLGMLNGKIGKFRLKRGYTQGKWEISIVEA